MRKEKQKNDDEEIRLNETTNEIASETEVS